MGIDASVLERTFLPRKGLKRKAHRKRIGAFEDLERKARFLRAWHAKMRPGLAFKARIPP
jgi:hypothetical protein